MRNIIFIFLICFGCSPEGCFKQGAFYRPSKQSHARIRAIIRHEKVVITQRIVLDTIKIIERKVIVDTIHVNEPQSRRWASLTTWRDSLHWLSYTGVNIPSLRVRANIIRNEVNPGWNSKQRLADMFIAIIDELENLKEAAVKLTIIPTNPITLKPQIPNDRTYFTVIH